jgi:hypothetical protein
LPTLRRTQPWTCKSLRAILGKMLGKVLGKSEIFAASRSKRTNQRDPAI